MKRRAELPRELEEKELAVSTLEELRKVRNLTDKPIAVNVRVAVEQLDAPYLIDAIIEECDKDPKLRKILQVVITSAGNPELYTKKLKDAGFKVIHVVPSVYHALKAVKAGCDAVVASGHEAGGHVAWEPMHTTVLVPAIRAAVPKNIPVISAGGWADGRGLVAALSLGAGAIYMGTRFIATKESDFAEGYKRAVVERGDRDTIVTAGSFGPIRVLKNKYSLRLQKVIDSIPGTFQSKFTHPEVLKAKNVSWAASYVYGNIEDSPVLLGESIALVNDLPTVKELIERIMNEAIEIIQKKLPSFIK
jgi:NAD(P)H-dependent flavin oxidoreductase YrpB (nitropropane dioxygenase family)